MHIALTSFFNKHSKHLVKLCVPDMMHCGIFAINLSFKKYIYNKMQLQSLRSKVLIYIFIALLHKLQILINNS